MQLENLEFAPRVSGPTGLGGWLILPIIGLFVTLIVVSISFLRDILPILSEPVRTALTTPGSPSYHSSWAPYIIATVLANSAIFFGALSLIFLAILKRSLFPRLIIVFYIVILLSASIDVWALKTFLPVVVPDEIEAMAPAIIKDFGRAVVACLVWIPYFLLSKRVSNTFVR